MAEEKKDKTKETTEVEKEASFENAEAAYQAAVKAENVEDATPALAYLRDTVNMLNATNKSLADENDNKDQRIAGLMSTLSSKMLESPIEAADARKEEPEVHVDDIISDILTD